MAEHRCAHGRVDHRHNGAGRCIRPGCPCLVGPGPLNRPAAIERTPAGGVVTVDESGVVVDYQPAQRQSQSERTRLERMLWRRIEDAGLPLPDQFEYRWARSEGRMYRSDGFYQYPIPTLIEVDGGTWIGGGHTRGSAYEHDRQRDNLAALMGLRILRFTKQMIRSGEAVATIRRALAQSTPLVHEWQETLPA